MFPFSIYYVTVGYFYFAASQSLANLGTLAYQTEYFRLQKIKVLGIPVVLVYLSLLILLSGNITMNPRPTQAVRSSYHQGDCRFGQSAWMQCMCNALTHFMPLISFYTPWKHQKNKGFQMFSGGIERDRGTKWFNVNLLFNSPKSNALGNLLFLAYVTNTITP